MWSQILTALSSVFFLRRQYFSNLHKCSCSQIVEYNLNKKRYTSFSRMLDQKHPKQWLNRQFPVEGILFDRTDPNVIMIYDDTTICIIDKTKVSSQ